MKCQVTLRTHDAARQWDLEEWSLVLLLASLSADPETFEELGSALRRYQPTHALFQQGRPVAPEEDSLSIDAPTVGVFPGEAPWCLIDLVGRTVVAGGALELPEIGKAYEPEEERAVSLSDDLLSPGSGVPCPIAWLDLADTWLFRAADDHWQAVVAARARAARRQPRIDTRQVLFGFPLLWFLADRVISSVASKGATGESSLTGDKIRAMRIRKIHADWLMTARDDLGGVAPRQVLLADHDRIQRDLEHRAVQWTMQGFAPPGLSSDSVACRFGSYGIVEVLHYFVLTRALLDTAWSLLESDRSLVSERLVQKLSIERDRCLATPLGEDVTGSPAEWIDSERGRMPITEKGVCVDRDGPMGQTANAGQAGPVFCWFDGHDLERENEFAFSLIRLRSDWEREREQEHGA